MGEHAKMALKMIRAWRKNPPQRKDQSKEEDQKAIVKPETKDEAPEKETI